MARREARCGIWGRRRGLFTRTELQNVILQGSQATLLAHLLDCREET